MPSDHSDGLQGVAGAAPDPAIQKRTFAPAASATVLASPLMSAAWGRAPALARSVPFVERQSGIRVLR
jgi:hypothetical protein